MTNPPHSDGPEDDRPGAGQPAPQPWGAPMRPSGGFPPDARAADEAGPGDTRPYGPPPFGSLPPGLPRYGQPPSGQSSYGQPPSGPPPCGQAGYGRPPYGQRPGGRPGKALVVGAVAVLALLAIGVVLALTTGPTVLSRSAVEQDVAEQFEQREGVAVDLECAEEMPVEAGATYECSGITTDDEEVLLRIEITDEDGRYTWSEP